MPESRRASSTAGAADNVLSREGPRNREGPSLFPFRSIPLSCHPAPAGGWHILPSAERGGISLVLLPLHEAAYIARARAFLLVGRIFQPPRNRTRNFLSRSFSLPRRPTG